MLIHCASAHRIFIWGETGTRDTWDLAHLQPFFLQAGSPYVYQLIRIYQTKSGFTGNLVSVAYISGLVLGKACSLLRIYQASRNFSRDFFLTVMLHSTRNRGPPAVWGRFCWLDNLWISRTFKHLFCFLLCSASSVTMVALWSNKGDKK